MTCVETGGAGCCKCLPIRVCFGIQFDDQSPDERYVEYVELECGQETYRAGFDRNGFDFDLNVSFIASPEEQASGACSASLGSEILGWTFDGVTDTRIHKILLTNPYDPEDEATLRDNCISFSLVFENVDMGYAGTGTVTVSTYSMICLDPEPAVNPDSQETNCKADVVCIYGINLPDLTLWSKVQRWWDFQSGLADRIAGEVASGMTRIDELGIGDVVGYAADSASNISVGDPLSSGYTIACWVQWESDATTQVAWQTNGGLSLQRFVSGDARIRIVNLGTPEYTSSADVPEALSATGWVLFVFSLNTDGSWTLNAAPQGSDNWTLTAAGGASSIPYATVNDLDLGDSGTPMDEIAVFKEVITDQQALTLLTEEMTFDDLLAPIPGVQRIRACLDPVYLNHYEGTFSGGTVSPNVGISVVQDDPTTLVLGSQWGNGDPVQADCPFMQARWDFNGGFQYGGWTIGVVADWRAGCGDCVCWSACLCALKFNLFDGGPSVQYGELCWDTEGYNTGSWTGDVQDPDDEFPAESMSVSLMCDRCSGVTYISHNGVTLPVNNGIATCPEISIEFEVPESSPGANDDYVLRVESKNCVATCEGNLAPACCQDEPDFPQVLIARPSLGPSSLDDCAACLDNMPDEVPLYWTEFPASALPPIFSVVGGAPSERYFAYMSEPFAYCESPFAPLNRLFIAPCGGLDVGYLEGDIPWTLIDAVHGIELYDASPCAPVILRFNGMECASSPADATISWELTEA